MCLFSVYFHSSDRRIRHPPTRQLVDLWPLLLPVTPLQMISTSHSTTTWLRWQTLPWLALFHFSLPHSLSLLSSVYPSSHVSLLFPHFPRCLASISSLYRRKTQSLCLVSCNPLSLNISALSETQCNHLKLILYLKLINDQKKNILFLVTMKILLFTSVSLCPFPPLPHQRLSSIRAPLMYPHSHQSLSPASPPPYSPDTPKCRTLYQRWKRT